MGHSSLTVDMIITLVLDERYKGEIALQYTFIQSYLTCNSLYMWHDMLCGDNSPHQVLVLKLFKSQHHTRVMLSSTNHSITTTFISFNRQELLKGRVIKGDHVVGVDLGSWVRLEFLFFVSCQFSHNDLVNAMMSFKATRGQIKSS